MACQYATAQDSVVSNYTIFFRCLQGDNACFDKGYTPSGANPIIDTLRQNNYHRTKDAILRGEECFGPIRFFDVGTLVWFARIIQWEFPDFSVDTHLDRLFEAQRVLEEHGSIDGSIHRFLLVAQK